jgi:hypothetical protein
VEILIWLEIAQLSVRFWSGQFFPEDRWPSLWAELYIKTVPATPQKCCQGTGHPSILDTQSGHVGGIFGGLHVDKMSLSKAAQEDKRLQYPFAMYSRRQRKFPGLQSFDELETHSGRIMLIPCTEDADLGVDHGYFGIHPKHQDNADNGACVFLYRHTSLFSSHKWHCPTSSELWLGTDGVENQVSSMKDAFRFARADTDQGGHWRTGPYFFFLKLTYRGLIRCLRRHLKALTTGLAWHVSRPDRSLRETYQSQ